MILQYKLRRKSDGLEYVGPLHDPGWATNGNAFRTPRGAAAVATSIEDDLNNLEVVEFEVIERRIIALTLGSTAPTASR